MSKDIELMYAVARAITKQQSAISKWPSDVGCHYHRSVTYDPSILTHATDKCSAFLIRMSLITDY